jgi:membrane-bound ClpP family serine protease
LNTALALIIAGIVLIVIDIFVASIAWLFWVGIVLLVVGLVLLVLDHNKRGGTRRANRV